MNSLATMVEQAMDLDPSSRPIFAFHNRGRNRIKLLLYDGSGFWLLDGIDIEAMRRHPARQYQHAS